jgi:hypothetical protein
LVSLGAVQLERGRASDYFAEGAPFGLKCLDIFDRRVVEVAPFVTAAGDTDHHGTG